jgi:dipeptidyl aminopeptidase/acylaminoacyl peptidase
MPRTLPAVALLLLAPLGFAQVAVPPLQTTGEATKFAKTSTSAEVVKFCELLAQQSPKVKHSTFGTSGEGRPLPLLVVSDPPVSGPEEAEKSGKPVVIVTANIHAGEVDGKEAVLALARDLVNEKDSPVLKKCVLVIAPNFNPDGNDKFGEWRKTQNGPKEVGTRANAGGYDLNRDFVKLETPETRAVVGLLNTWKPVMVIDCHTTNGSYHRYTLTYDGPRMPACDPRLIAFAQTKLFPATEEKVKKATGFDTFTYGDFDKDHAQWLTYGTGPRYGTQLYSLRGSLGILSESYTYSSFEDRVRASYAFVKANCEYVAENADAVKALVADAKKTRAKVALRTKTVAREKPLTVFGYVEVQKDGRTVRTEEKKDYTCRIIDKLEPTLEVDVPRAYLIPAEYSAVADNLRRHGIRVEEVREQIDLPGETYTVTDTKLAATEFQKHKTRTVEATAATGTVRAEPGMFLVSTTQDLGQLAAYLLEPMAEDGLTTWNFFDAGIATGKTFPVRRITADKPVFTGEPRPLPETVAAKRPFTLDMIGGRGGAGLAGAPMGNITWLDDGQHWLQTKNRKLWKLNARTGDAEVFVDVANLRKSLTATEQQLPKGLNEALAAPNYTFNPSRSAVLLSTGEALYVVARDGSPAKKIVAKGAERPTFSPDGLKLGFTHAGNLFAADVTTGKVTQLTTDGGKNEILNGQADWVYEEEIFNRNGQAFWWSPDGKAIAFLRFDDSKVPKFTLTSADGKPESINYPKAGQTNPTAKIGVVSASGEKPEPQFLDLGEYKPDDTLFARVGWVPGNKVFAYVQNRTQTWLDFVTWANPTAKPTRLFRETTKAWVEDLGEPKFLKDGSFLVLSERTGWKHVYHYSADGTTGVPITEGKWEVKGIERVDEGSGDVYLTGTKVSHTGNHLLLANLNGQEVEVLSPKATTHRIELAPTGTLYVDRESDDNTPTRTILRELRAKLVRVLDANPAYEREKFLFGKYERQRVKLSDGFELEAAITYPPDFHPLNRYPIWILTYAGPHAPTVRDGWGTGRLFENVLAAHGVVVLRVDPRSASGKGAESAWTCYKQLGVQELKDLEEAVDWIGKNPWADTTRVGLSGHSYGGFMAGYALTHSKKFAAGIAGAPVTDWTYYDTIYTERYMGLPSENKAGYGKTSVVKAARNLHGKLLICHGLVDDNVHPQNSLQLVNALQAAGKDFEVMVYPGSRHGIIPAHYPRLQAKFALKALGVEK